jgi:hypothetical protein
MHGQVLGQHSPHKQEYIYIYSFILLFFKTNNINNKSFLFFLLLFLFFFLPIPKAESRAGKKYFPASAYACSGPLPANICCQKKLKKNTYFFLKRY